MARIIGVDINSINVKMITNTFETLPLDILQNNEHPSFTKFQAPFRIHSQGSAAESSSETQWVDVSMFIKTTRRCYPIAFRLVHFNKLERWYLTEITTAFMYGQSMDDYYLL